MSEPIEINGEPPQLAGAICDELKCVQHWYRGQLHEEAHVIYLSFGGRWYRLYFDCGIIFWRIADSGPEPFRAEEIEAAYPVMDLAEQLGIRGQRLVCYEMEPSAGGAQVAFTFANGRRLAFRNVRNHTSVVV